MSREAILQRLEKERIVAVVRLKAAEDMPALAEALAAGGVRAIEVTLTTTNAIECIRDLDKRFGDELFIGVGSVLTTDDATAAVEAGAKYVVSPVFDPAVIDAAHAANAAAMPGCFTPTEIHRATQAGADVVKVFPADVVGIPFFKAVRAPMPHLRMMPTGGVTLDNAGEWIAAGAIAVGAGSALCSKAALESKDWAAITANAQRIRASADA
ncbi:bifunctional 4-hydroxy-2-oxoglutarate aldolase/2-dehydro-3-deoxy-phosphogluconate aldolase [Mucisphaera calidilacus]|uniref:KHG/KDPG aldolase n=1 Tax=Mucisphaera calidilacus TaxID=2527982 RepID=A0A518C0A4_9BACT|nr:bifunctional 4-hydroxy-2-oxoglutarate aldolase/2-dehydro-3-deoxy-phosphogluconate aldolase [Mucisphaera calidilacus]QDU72655.1 KHG/KDPG aldolase [Mucisphaera calidilacus]